MASIVKRPNGRWQATYKVRGREYSRTFDRKVDARAWAHAAEQEANRGSWASPRASRMLVDDWIDLWLPTRKADLRATSHERLHSICDRHIRPRWGRRQLDKVTNSEVRQWAVELQERMSARTARKVMMVFRQLLAAAVDDQRLYVNPAARVPLPSDHGVEQAWMTLPQAIALRASINPRYEAVILLGYWCGLRFGELTALRRSDVLIAQSRLRVERTAQVVNSSVVMGPPKTASSRRTVPVPRSVMHDLVEFMNAYTDDDEAALVITSTAGTPVLRQNFLRRTWRPALAAADLPTDLTPHSMRHGYASLLIAGGFSPKEVSQWCGHASSVVTLSVYAHIAAEQEDDAPDRLDLLLAQTDTVDPS